MVIEALGPPSSGALSFVLSSMEEILCRDSKPWAIIEGNDGSVLYPPALSKTLRVKMSEGRLLWVRVSEKEIPEVFLNLLQSSLFAGVFLRAFEVEVLGQKMMAWLRRWQLASEKTGTHWLWQHRKPCPRLGVSVSLAWQKKSPNGGSDFEILKGHSFFENCELKSFEALRTETRRRKLAIEKREKNVLSRTDSATA
jgi:hypothetical protein